MELVTVERGEQLYPVGQTIDYAYFPQTALVSLVGLTTDGQGTEVGMVGDEGFLGVPILFGAVTQQYAATIQVGGSLWKLPKDVIVDMKNDDSPFINTLHLYATVRLTQLVQSAICNRFHTLKQRLCRWLLTVADRIGRDDLELTQEFLSQMIGARRPAVAVTMGRLQRKGFLSCKRGHIVLQQRQALEAVTCECYEIVNRGLRNFLNARNLPMVRAQE